MLGHGTLVIRSCREQRRRRRRQVRHALPRVVSHALLYGDHCRFFHDGLLALTGQGREPGEIAADAEAAVTAKDALAIEHRQAGQLDCQPLQAVVNRPDNGETAPSIMRGHRAGDLALGIEVEVGRDVGPTAPQHGCSARTDQRDEFVRAEREASLVIHLPDEAEWVASLGRCFRREGGRS